MFEIQKVKIQQKLLDSKDFTFQAAVKIAQSFKSPEADVKSRHIGEGMTSKSSKLSNPTMKVEKPKVEKFAYVCKPKDEKFTPEKAYCRCSKNHNPKFCSFKNVECHFYNKLRNLKI